MSTLVSAMILTVLMTWVAMPLLTGLARRWLYPTRVSVIGCKEKGDDEPRGLKTPTIGALAGTPPRRVWYRDDYDL